MQKIPENERKRNCTCVRWDDKDMNIVVESAHSKRTSCSSLIRTIVLERLQNKEVGVEQKQNA